MPRGFSSLAVLALLAAASEPVAPLAREDAHRANNVGVALLEQVSFGPGAEAFRKALALDPALDIAQVNLAIALFNVPELAAAQREAQVAVSRSPSRPEAHYVAGLVAKAQNRPEDALASLRRVLEIDPGDVGANVNLAQVLMQQQKHADAVLLLRRASEAEPYNATAAYSLATALLRSGQADEGRKQMERFQKLREAGYATSLSQNYPMQGRYAEALVATGSEAALVDARTPAVVFKDEKAPGPAASGATTVTLGDVDADGDLDPIAGGVAGDYDNDGRADVLLVQSAGLKLARGTIPALAFAPRTAAFVDVDHDGDLDIVAGGAGTSGTLALLRNNGGGKLADATAEAKLGGVTGTVVALVPTDFDNHRDVDLLVVREEGPVLLQNRRDGTFRDVTADAGLKVAGPIASVAAGDVNKDTYTDFFFGRAGGAGVFALSDGKERFIVADAPEATAGAASAQLLDYDNDGLLDLVTGGADGLRVFRNLGDRWSDVTSTAAPAPRVTGVQGLASGDVDGDGDTDLVIAAKAGLRLARNDGGERGASLRVALAGKTSNRAGIGAKVEARSGSLRHKLESSAAVPAAAPADIVFGLGARKTVDAIRILWPSGTLQAETELPPVAVDPKAASRRAAVRTVEELDRTPSSCPYLFAWNGERFQFVTDFMGGGEMGAWLAPGVRNRPDPEEYVRIRPDQLKARDGRYELRLTHELEEVLYVDSLELVAVDHPEDTEVFPNEGLTDPPRPYHLHVTRGARPPAAAVDDKGRDVLDRVRHADGRAVDGFPVTPIRGYAEPHALTLDLGAAAPRPRLLLTGWTEYAFSSDNVAAHQAGLTLVPPAVEARGADGRWTTIVADAGFPVGRPQTIVLDLPPGSHHVRVTTNMRVFWDQVQVDDGDGAPDIVTRRLPASAALRERGFSAGTRAAGATTLDFDYVQVSTAFPWKRMPGRYTRAGDVGPLLAAADDRFVIAHPGDELALTFDAAAVPPPARGYTRTFLLHVDGFSKEMNLHSASPDVVAPLPFHGMSEYPYDPADAPARTEAHLADLERYHTREVMRPLPRLETVSR